MRAKNPAKRVKKAREKITKRRKKLKDDAERQKYKEWLRARSQTVRKVLKRQAEIERIDRQWTESGGSPLPSGKGKGIKKTRKRL